MWLGDIFSGLVKFALVEFDLVGLVGLVIHRQRKKLNNYLVLINLICKFVFGLVIPQTNKQI